MLKANELYTARIEDYTAEGQGVAKIEGCAVFVPNAILGELAKIRIVKARPTWAAGKLVEILEKSPHRVNRECPVGKLCGGCDFQHMDYEAECQLKVQRVRQCLERMAGETVEDLPILAAEDIRNYRNKVQYPVQLQNGKPVAGFFRAGTHQVVSTPRCGIVPPEADRVRDAVMAHVNDYRVSVYDEATGKGLLRHIYVRRGVISGQILVCLVVNGTAFPRWQRLVERLKTIPGFTTLVLSVNEKKGNTVLGDRFIPLYGPGYIEDILCGLRFRLSPQTFYQVNHPQAQRLYQAAIDLARITKEDLVLDLCCGAGTITLCMAAAAGKVVGVEIVPQAVEDARENAKRNGIQNAEFICGDVAQVARELAEAGQRPDVVTVDPPRKGLAPVVLEAIATMAPRRLVYISCDPATMARDVALLKEKGFRLEKALAADLFPRCAHVETVCLMSRKEK